VKCDYTHKNHPLVVNSEVVLKNIKRVWDEVSPTFRSLGPRNMILIDDCPFKYVSNTPFSYTLPLAFNLQIKDNDFINTL
jgi:hypothetical protein